MCIRDRLTVAWFVIVVPAGVPTASAGLDIDAAIPTAVAMASTIRGECQFMGLIPPGEMGRARLLDLDLERSHPLGARRQWLPGGPANVGVCRELDILEFRGSVCLLDGSSHRVAFEGLSPIGADAEVSPLGIPASRHEQRPGRYRIDQLRVVRRRPEEMRRSQPLPASAASSCLRFDCFLHVPVSETANDKDPTMWLKVNNRPLEDRAESRQGPDLVKK